MNLLTSNMEKVVGLIVTHINGVALHLFNLSRNSCQKIHDAMWKNNLIYDFENSNVMKCVATWFTTKNGQILKLS